MEALMDVGITTPVCAFQSWDISSTEPSTGYVKIKDICGERPGDINAFRSLSPI